MAEDADETLKWYEEAAMAKVQCVKCGIAIPRNQAVTVWRVVGERYECTYTCQACAAKGGA